MGKLAQQSQRSTVIKSNIPTNTNGIHGVVKVKRTRKTVPRDSPPQRSSIYRGVTRHRWTGRYEAHLWDKNCWNESQNKKGRQGAYDDEAAAAHAYDLAALKYWGPETILNFPLVTYQKELKDMEAQSREEYIGSLRRKSSGFSRGVSKYRGVARHHHNGRWEARIGRVFGNKYLYLGTYATQEEAAVAYDMAAIEYRGLNAVTNFDLSRYIKWLRPDGNNSDSTAANTLPDPKVETPNTLPSLIHHDHVKSNTHETKLLHHHQQPTQPSLVCVTDNNLMALNTPPPPPVTATSALGLLLQSSKFKEMMEMTTAAEYYPITSSDSEPPRSCNFPDDIQTYFGSQDLSSYAVGDEFIFGDLNSLMQPLLHADSSSSGGIDHYF
ncbi:AP2-like ethylene-responsive transcription factor [Heracleum sosnowskyi]|uniref:AP2-like ethylene-responsive transcription factor n=1 Tax=Heracleum sosnowskyi TaxID=360622 RepID=A0AAD8N8G6_9APIA|nr:AP2-like ethylene-responsive transcription factor [Heracleum sosnowskyi]